MRVTCLLVLSSFAFSALAQVSFRPQAGLGFTDNANFEDTQKDADFFWWVRSSNSLLKKDSEWNLWLNYRGYFKEHQNNVLTYRLGDTLSGQNSAIGTYEWDLAAGGQKYTEESPGTTESSFDNVYAETSLLKTWGLQKNLDLNFEPLYQFKYYPQFDGRSDHTLSANLLFDWNFHVVQSLNPYLEIGWVQSSLSLYSKNYLEFGTAWKYTPRPDLKYMLNLLSKYSAYPSRKVSETTVISDKRGRSRSLSQDGIETQSLIQFQGTVVKILEKAELRGTIGFSQQSTRSGIEDYSEFQCLASILVPL